MARFYYILVKKLFGSDSVRRYSCFLYYAISTIWPSYKLQWVATHVSCTLNSTPGNLPCAGIAELWEGCTEFDCHDGAWTFAVLRFSLHLRKLTFLFCCSKGVQRPVAFHGLNAHKQRLRPSSETFWGGFIYSAGLGYMASPGRI